MSDGSISQAEIDALLSGVGGGSTGAELSEAGGEGLSPFKQSAIVKFVKGNTAGLSSNLESMTGKSLTISSPTVELIEREGFLKKVPEMVVASLIDFSGSLSGDHVFVISPELSKKIVSSVNHEDTTELDDMALSVISETIAQYASTELTALDAAGLHGVTSNPAESLHVPKAMIRLPQRNFTCITYAIEIDGTSYNFWEVLADNVTDAIVKAIAGHDPSDAQNDVATQSVQKVQQNDYQNYTGGVGMQGGMNGMQMGNMGMQGGMPMQNMGMATNVQSVQFPPFQGAITQEEQGNIGLIMDVYMEMTVELGRTKKMIKEILGMGEGHIIELDKLAGEPVDVLVNHKPIAKGEVVVIEESFGVRITEILSPAERIADI